jgi:hypothetical protein
MSSVAIKTGNVNKQEGVEEEKKYVNNQPQAERFADGFHDAK